MRSATALEDRPEDYEAENCQFSQSARQMGILMEGKIKFFATQIFLCNLFEITLPCSLHATSMINDNMKKSSHSVLRIFSNVSKIEATFSNCKAQLYTLTNDFIESS